MDNLGFSLKNKECVEDSNWRGHVTPSNLLYLDLITFLYMYLWINFPPKTSL
jgi:hypothetical protein